MGQLTINVHENHGHKSFLPEIYIILHIKPKTNSLTFRRTNHETSRATERRVIRLGTKHHVRF